MTAESETCMRRATAVHRRARATTFTLVELLTVMVIVAVLMAVAIPTMLKITSGSSVEAASRMIGAQLRLARQEAITKRKYVAVLFPTVASTDGDEVAYVGFRPCYIENQTGTYVFDGWVSNVSWHFASVGALVREVDADQPSGGSPPDFTDNTFTTVINSSPADPDFTFSQPVRAIVFRPSGRLADAGERNVTIVEGAMPEGAASPMIKQASNWINIEVNQYTGRVRFQRPEDL